MIAKEYHVASTITPRSDGGPPGPSPRPRCQNHPLGARSGLDRPIFIVGTGRCGSTILHEIFTHHPQVSSLSSLSDRYPDRPRYNQWAMRMFDVPYLGPLARRAFPPGEHWRFWEHHARGFSEPCRDLRADDVRPVEACRVARVLAELVAPKRPRLLAKLTGWPRVGYLSEIFPDALFIHVYRDGRAVVNSLLEVDFWEGWRGPEHWRWGELGPEHREEWLRYDRSFVALAAIEWKILMDAFETAKARIPASQYLEVRYEDFAADPAGLFGTILEFCHLDDASNFQETVRRFDIQNKNYKWKEQLTPRQQAILMDCLADYLRRYGYPV